MKKITFIIAVFLAANFYAQNTVSVDGTKDWKSYVAAFNVSNNAFAFGFEYNIDLAKTTFTSNTATLQPNFAIWADNNPTVDPGWFDDATTPNKIVEVSSFVEDASLAASDLIFTGNIDSHTISNGYEVEAFIKALDPNNGYSTVTNNRVTLNSGDSSFSVSATAAELTSGFIIQYGFSVTGLIADPENENSLGSVVVSDNTLSNNDFAKVNFEVYPNPASSQWTIDAGTESIESVEVFNLSGKLVMQAEGNKQSKLELDASQLNPGVYLATIMNASSSKSVKLIKK